MMKDKHLIKSLVSSLEHFSGYFSSNIPSETFILEQILDQIIGNVHLRTYRNSCLSQKISYDTFVSEQISEYILRHVYFKTYPRTLTYTRSEETFILGHFYLRTYPRKLLSSYFYIFGLVHPALLCLIMVTLNSTCLLTVDYLHHLSYLDGEIKVNISIQKLNYNSKKYKT